MTKEDKSHEFRLKNRSNKKLWNKYNIIDTQEAQKDMQEFQLF